MIIIIIFLIFYFFFTAKSSILFWLFSDIFIEGLMDDIKVIAVFS